MIIRTKYCLLSLTDLTVGYRTSGWTSYASSVSCVTSVRRLNSVCCLMIVPYVYVRIRPLLMIDRRCIISKVR